ncbi:MAG: histidine triad family protein [Chloroflexota bacterium]|nr:histidine triad family protein [Chloroflexota bacterium]
MTTTVDCIFCRIIAGEIPAEFLHKDDLVVAIADLHPKAPTHLLLMPVEHVASAANLTDADAPMLGRLFAVAARLAAEAGVVESGYRLVANAGKGAGQSVPHLHFHLLGGRSMRWPPG